MNLSKSYLFISPAHILGMTETALENIKADREKRKRLFLEGEADRFNNRWTSKLLKVSKTPEDIEKEREEGRGSTYDCLDWWFIKKYKHNSLELVQSLDLAARAAANNSRNEKDMLILAEEYNILKTWQ